MIELVCTYHGKDANKDLPKERYGGKYKHNTRMHSSRMHTGRSLTVCRGGGLVAWGSLPAGGSPCQGIRGSPCGGSPCRDDWVSPSRGVSLPRGVTLLGGLPAHGGCPCWGVSLPRGSLCPGGLLARGVSLLGGSLPRSLPARGVGVLPARDLPCGQNHRHV